MNALNFAKAIPIDNKYLVILGGIKLTQIPAEKVEKGKFNIYLIDVLTNEVVFQKPI